MMQRGSHSRASLSSGATPVEHRRAFTLLELLVVIAIITLLLAVLIAGLSAARASAKSAVCKSNLSELAKGWQMYLDDNDDCFPKGISMNWKYGGKQGLADAASGVSKPLNMHVGLDDIIQEGADVFRCPADEGGGIVAKTHYDYYGTSYTTNLMLIGEASVAVLPWDPCWQLKREANKYIGDLRRHQIARPGKLILMGDGGWISAWEIGTDDVIDWHRRDGMYNIAFMDGHVDFIRIRKGLHETRDYHVMPLASLAEQARDCQEEVLDE